MAMKHTISISILLHTFAKSPRIILMVRLASFSVLSLSPPFVALGLESEAPT